MIFIMLGCILGVFLYIIFKRKTVDPKLQKIYKELEQMKVEEIKQRLTQIESKVNKLK